MNFQLPSKFQWLKLLYCSITIILLHSAAGYAQVSSTNKGNIISLDLSYSNLRQLPSDLASLKNLNTLILNGLPIENLPAFITQLPIENLYLNDCPNIDIVSLTHVLGQLSTLKTLSLANCNLFYLPLEFASLIHLEELNLSGNYLSELPYNLKSLPNLKKLNLSNNRFAGNISLLKYYENLEYVNLSNNPLLDADACVRALSNHQNLTKLIYNGMPHIPSNIYLLKNLRYLELKHTVLEDFPKGFSKLDSLRELILSNEAENNYTAVISKLGSMHALRKLEFMDNQITQLPQGFGQLNDLEELKIMGKNIEFLSTDFINLEKLVNLNIHLSPKINVEELFRTISKMPALQHLDLSYNNLGFLPANIEDLKTIKSLNLSGNSLTSVPYLIKNAGIEELNLTDNPIETITVRDLETQFTTCNVIYDEEETNTNLDQDELSPYIPSSKTFYFNAMEGFHHTAATYSIDIEGGSLVDRDGNPVSGQVMLSFNTIPNAAEMSVRLHTNTENIGISSQLYGQGFFIRLSQSNTEINIRPGSYIRVGLVSEQKDIFEIYHFKDQNHVRQLGNDSLVNVVYDAEESTASYRPENEAHEPDFEQVYFKFYNPFTSRTFKFGIHGTQRNYKNYESNYDLKSYPEMQLLKRYKWVYDGSNAKHDFRYFKNIVKKAAKSEGQSQIKDIRLLANTERDNYLMRFVYKLDTINIPVFLDLRTRKHTRIQQKNKYFFEKYEPLLKQRLHHWNTIDSINMIRQLAYQEKMDEFRSDYLAGKNKRSMFMHTINIDQNGYWSLVPEPGLAEQKLVKLRLCTMDFTPVKPKLIVVYYPDQNMAQIFNSTLIKVDLSKKYQFITFLSDNTISMTSARNQHIIQQYGEKTEITIRLNSVMPLLSLFHPNNVN